MKKNLTKIAAVASLATILTPVVASANSVSTDIDHALRLEQTAHADGTQNDRIDWTGVTNTNLKDSGGYVYGAGTKVARSKQQGNYWLYLAETGTGVVHYGEVPEQYVTPTGQVTNHLDNYGSTVVINNSLRSNDSMAGELEPTNDAPTQTGSNNNYQEGNNGSASSSSQTGNTTGNQGTQNPSAGSSSQAKPGTGATSGSQTKPGVNTSSTSSTASSASQAKPGTGASSSSSQAQPGHNVSGTVTGVAGNHDNGGATTSSSSQSSETKPTGDKTSSASASQAQKPAAGQASQAKPAGDKASSASQAKPAQGNNVKADAGKTANKVTDKKTPAKTQAGHHVVTAGETLSGIAKANGTTVGAIVKANPSITNPASVKVGTDLVMPAANGGQAVTPQGQSVAKATPTATSQTQAKASEKAAPVKGELLKTGAQDNEKGAVIASMSAVAGLVGLAALNRKKKFNY